MTTLISEREHTARKPHRCDECTTRIEPGQRYSLQVQSDGELLTYKAHVECLAAARDYRQVCDLRDDDDSYPLRDSIDCGDDQEWLLAEYPIVADRLGIKVKVTA